MLTVLLIIVLVLLLFGAYPAYTHPRAVTYHVGPLLTVLFVVLLVLLIFRLF